MGSIFRDTGFKVAFNNTYRATEHAPNIGGVETEPAATRS